MTSEEQELVLKDSDEIDNFELEDILNKVIHGDALRILKKIPSSSVDLVFVDPPYFLQLPKKTLKRWNVKTDVKGVEDKWDQFSSFEDYDIFIEEILKELKGD